MSPVERAPTRQVWCQHALLPGGVADGVLVSFDAGRIVAVQPGVDAPSTDAERLVGLTVPGFANGHSHAFHRALRGRTHGNGGDFWTWREQMYRVAARLTPERYLDLARATFAEMVLAGYTCVGEFHYVHHQPGGAPHDDPNAMGLALVDAAAEAGIRMTLLDACYLRGGASQPLTAEQLAFSDGTAEAWCGRVDALRDVTDGRRAVRVGAAIHSVRAVDAASIAVVARYAEHRSLPLHAHVSEQLAENEQVDAEYGCTPTAILAQQGALSERFTAVHATHLDAGDVALYAGAQCTCCFCPTTERDLADGIGPSAELRAAGVALSIGSDQHAVVDPFEEMRGIELDERLRSMRRGTHPPVALLTAATTNGYRSLGWSDGGSIVVGGLADLVALSLDGVRLAGSMPDTMLEAMVFAATASDVSTVIVDGVTRVRNGGHVTIDVAAALRAAIAALDLDDEMPADGR